MERNNGPADNLRPICFEGVQKWLDGGLHQLLASAPFWGLKVDLTTQDATFQLDVSDDKSATDSSAIRLSNGYSASGYLKGGHIEIHKGCHNDIDDHDKDRKDNDHKDHN
jgi:hypothetical protein